MIFFIYLGTLKALLGMCKSFNITNFNINFILIDGRTKFEIGVKN